MSNTLGRPTAEEAQTRRLIEKELQSIQSSSQLLRRLQQGREAEEMADEEGDHKDQAGERSKEAPGTWQDAFVLLQEQMTVLMQRIPEQATQGNAVQGPISPEERASHPSISTDHHHEHNTTVDDCGNRGQNAGASSMSTAQGATSQGQGPTATAYATALRQREQVRTQALMDQQPPDLMLSIVYATRQILTEDPPKFDMEQGAKAFDAWKRRWANHVARATERCNPETVYKHVMSELVRALSDDTWNWLVNQHHLQDHLEDPDALVDALERQVYKTTNIINMMLTAGNKRKSNTEKFDSVVQEIDRTVKYFVQFCKDDVEDGLKRFFLVLQTTDKRLQTKLMEKFNTSKFHQLAEMARQSEIVSAHVEHMFEQGQVNHTTSYQAGKTGGPKGGHKGRGRSSEGTGGQRSQSQGRDRPQPKKDSKKCSYCGKDSHDRSECPAKGSTCQRCQKKGHFAAVCRAPTPVLSANQSEVPPSVNAISTAQRASIKLNGSCMQVNDVVTRLDVEPLDTIPVTLSDRTGYSSKAQGLADTGANVNLLPDSLGKTFATYQLADLPASPKTANGGSLPIKGIVVADVFSNDVMLKDIKWLTADINKIILSRQLTRDLDLIPANFPFARASAAVRRESNGRKVGTVTFSDSQLPFSNNAALECKSQDGTFKVTFKNAPELDSLASEFPEVFGGHIGQIRGPPAKIELRPDAIPNSAGAHRRIAEAFLEPLKREIDEQLAAGILEPAPESPDGHAWLHPIVVVPKKGTANVRLCVDFRRLNKYCLRPNNPESTPWEQIRSLPAGKKWFATFDANKGYHQVPLDEEGRRMTTFHTPHGRFRYTALPMGYAGSQDIFTERFGKAVDKFVDARATEDCLIVEDTLDRLLHRVRKFFEACREAGITLNQKKTQCGSSVIFAGFKIDSSGAMLNPELYKAISEFPTPQNLTNLRSFLGLCNQQAQFVDTISELAHPFHNLLKKRNEFVWTTEHAKAFERMKAELAKPQSLAYYDHRLPTRLYTDASRLNGLGFVLKQRRTEGWKIVQAGSRFLSSAEERYAMVELELLAIAWACKKASTFLEGIAFTIVTDHKPLIPILRDYALSEIENKRLQRLRMKIDHLRYDVTWVKGSENIEADALSRSPSSRPEPEDEIDEDDQQMSMVVQTLFAEEYDLVETVDVKDPLIKLLMEEAHKDANYCKVKEWLVSGFPSSKETVPEDLVPYWLKRDQLCLEKNGLVLFIAERAHEHPRLLIPEGLRQRTIDVLRNIHGHPSKMTSRARRAVWWPFMHSQLLQEHRKCKTCVEKSPSNPQNPDRPHEPAMYPFQKIHLDFADYAGRKFLFGADQFSGWPIAKELGKDAPTSKLIEALLPYFANHGIPSTIYSDGGPQFTSQEFARFCERNFIEHIASSPYYPKSNGVAENAVKQMKKLVHCVWNSENGKTREEEWMKAILSYCNTPKRPHGMSPAQLLYGRELRDLTPAPLTSYVSPNREAVMRRLQSVRDHQEALLREERLKPLKVGDRVIVQDKATGEWTKQGQITKLGRNDREYLAQLDDGAVVQRNRHFFKLLSPPEIPIITTESPSNGNPQLSSSSRRGRPTGSKNQPKSTNMNVIRRSKRIQSK